MGWTGGRGVLWRAGRMFLRGVATGFFVCAGVVCAAADAASNSKAGIPRVVFILSSAYGESGGVAAAAVFRTSAFRLYNHSNECQYSISFASSPLVCSVGHGVIATPKTFLAMSLLTEHMPRKTSVCRKSDMRCPKGDKRSELSVKYLFPRLR